MQRQLHLKQVAPTTRPTAQFTTGAPLRAEAGGPPGQSASESNFVLRIAGTGGKSSGP